MQQKTGDQYGAYGHGKLQAANPNSKEDAEDKQNPTRIVHSEGNDKSRHGSPLDVFKVMLCPICLIKSHVLPKMPRATTLNFSVTCIEYFETGRPVTYVLDRRQT
jgi:hypothetical protein